MFSFPKVAYDPDPFPHCVVRLAWDPDQIAKCKEFCAYTKWTAGKHGKSFCSDWTLLPRFAERIIRFASQPRFLLWLEETTGEKSLLPDPYLFGGGLHRIQRGGSLGMHIDFNYHGIGLYRRLNLLLYLNDGWKPEWGGYLSLAGKKKIAPDANTMVIFTTDDLSWHGHPEPLACPEGVYRDSIALYYYSATKPTRNFAEVRPTTEYES